jgi:uncharacterized protein (DUF697 family)/tellurite resistance protein
MKESEREQIALACLAAAFADSHLNEAERARIRRLIEDIGGLEGRDLFRTVIDRQLEPEQVAQSLSSATARRTAYEMALLVVQADGAPNQAEEDYLERLRKAVGLSEAAAKGIRLELEQYRDPGLPPTAPPAAEDGEALDRMILQFAILAGAAELLPQAAASMLILPLQLKLVHDIGHRHGVRMGRDQLRELLMAFGIGATSQVVESFARRVMGGLARQVGGRGVLGGVLGGAANAATGTLVSFSTTYALGHAAQMYYERGRTLTEQDLKALFQRFQDDAHTLYPRVEAEIREQAESLDTKALLDRVRGLV